MNLWNRTVGAALLAFCAVLPVAHANVLIGGTRVVLPAKDGEVTVRLTNANEHPALVQAWIDRGDPKATPDTVDTPFLITPPMFRMEAGRDQSLRILYTREPLPSDRESLFWLNVLEIPPKPADGELAKANYLQLALRSRLKLFFRPQGLTGDPNKAPEQLTFRAAAGELIVRNPTPYHITVSELAVTDGGKSFDAEAGMVAPFGELRLRVPTLAKTAPAGAAVRYTTINDYGAASAFTASVTP
ncbi:MULTISPECIES: molecular chaperone [unclassified Lysobacter]|uniref:fimbrial biogenesis chaperone n=1 Tax=unclassified Lysobacter TaxID=2635362 RepID=UPI001C236A87|nr:molecular chaperone [Lysobacter sp. MMG2]MBU8977297.1 molecular chaperone [Lysobacter sp. MMG2]